MAAFGKGISRRVGAGWGRRVLGAVALAVVAVASPPLTERARAQRAISDPLYSAQWSLAQIRAPAAWTRSTGSRVRIGIVDTGVQAGHEDLAGKVVASTNCIGAGGNPGACSGIGQDDNGHGTHVAGIAAAARNGRGMVGVAPDAMIVAAKVLNQDEGGTIADVEAGIRWVVGHGAQVVNLSVGDNANARSTSTELSFQKAVEEAWNAGAIPVVAAGNPNALGPTRESFSRVHALVVGATNPNGSVAGYSNPLGSAAWGLVAPGGAGTNDGRDVVSSFWLKSNPASTSSYAWRSGASMAAAHVSGVAALLLAQGLTRDEVVQRVLGTAAPIGCGGACHGRLDAAAAVAAPSPPMPIAPAPTRILRPTASPPRTAPSAPPTTAASESGSAPPAVTPLHPSAPAAAPEVEDAARAGLRPEPLATHDVRSTHAWDNIGRWATVLVLLGLGGTTMFLDIRARRQSALRRRSV